MWADLTPITEKAAAGGQWLPEISSKPQPGIYNVFLPPLKSLFKEASNQEVMFAVAQIKMPKSHLDMHTI